MEKPLLSIVTITYNHAPFIAKTIEGVLMQQVNFLIEFIIAEDCSTDNTRAICQEYAAKYPDIIRLITSDTNVGGVTNERRALLEAKGKYIALCEGDDYWTDPLKLQKQVDFLEANPDYSVTFHRYKIHHLHTDTWQDDDCGHLFEKNEISGTEMTTHMFLNRWMTQYLSVVYRKEAFDTQLIDNYTYFRDSHLIYHLLQNGRGFIFSFFGGVYSRTGTGTFTNLSQYNTAKTMIYVYEEIWKKNADKRVREMYVIASQYFIDSFYSNKKHVIILLYYAFRIYFITFNFKVLINNFLKILTNK